MRNVVPKNSFSLLLHEMLSVFSTINLNLNSSTCERFIVEHWDNIWCNLMHLKKSVMGLEISAFKNCNKWALVYKDYWRWKVYILNKCSYSNWKTIQPRLKYPHPFKKYWSTYESSLDLLVSYHDFLLMFSSPIVG